MLVGTLALVAVQKRKETAQRRLVATPNCVTTFYAVGDGFSVGALILMHVITAIIIVGRLTTFTHRK